MRLIFLSLLCFLSKEIRANTYNFNFYNENTEGNPAQLEEPAQTEIEAEKIETNKLETTPRSESLIENKEEQKTSLSKYWRFGIGARHKSYVGLKADNSWGLGRSDYANQIYFKLTYGKPGGIQISPYIGIGTFIYNSKLDFTNSSFNTTDLRFKSRGAGLELKKEFLLQDRTGIFLGLGGNYFINTTDFYKVSYGTQYGNEERDRRTKINQTSGYLLAGVNYYLSSFAIDLTGAYGIEQSSMALEQLFYESDDSQEFMKYKEKYAQLSASLSTLF